MALALADSITSAGWDLNDQARRYVRWWRHGDYSVNGRCFDIGITTRSALSTFERLNDARHSGDSSERASGNGSIMRLAPVAIRYADRYPGNLAQLAKFSAESSLPTHASPQCLSACRYLAIIECGLIHGIDRDEVLSPEWRPLSELRAIEPLHPSVDEVARGSFRRRNPPEIVGSGYVVKSLEAALWAFYAADSFEDAVLRAVNLGNDADTTGAVCGQIAGAFWGEEAIPVSWRQGLARFDMIEPILDRLSLCRAYEATDFCVDDAPGGAIKIRSGDRSPPLDRLLANADCDEWIYITACNPGSRSLSDEENARRMRELESSLNGLPCVVYHGRGVGTVGDWPPEPSVLVLGLSEKQGMDLGLKFGQAAIVVGRRGEPARLAWPVAASGK
jgi:ADP-ribosylglycohydrolase